MTNFASLDLNLLRVLDALLREGSTVKAGERIGLSQPAVSGALSRLRHALADELFVRRGGRLVPTDFAAGLAMPLREELDRLEAILMGPRRFDPAIATQVFKLSGSDFFSEMLMPRLAQELLRRAPGVRMQLVDLVPQSYISSLERYEADMVLIPLEDFPDWVDHRPLFRSGFVAIAREAHPAIAAAGIAPGQTIPMDLFCNLSHVLFSPEGKLRAMGDAALAGEGRQRKVAMTLPVFSGVVRTVSQSDFIALVPRQLGEHMAPLMGLSVYKPPMAIEPAIIVGAWHKRSTANPAHRWMRELVAEVLLPLNGGEAPLPPAS